MTSLRKADFFKFGSMREISRLGNAILSGKPRETGSRTYVGEPTTL